MKHGATYVFLLALGACTSDAPDLFLSVSRSTSSVELFLQVCESPEELDCSGEVTLFEPGDAALSRTAEIIVRDTFESDAVQVVFQINAGARSCYALLFPREQTPLRAAVALGDGSGVPSLDCISDGGCTAPRNCSTE